MAVMHNRDLEFHFVVYDDVLWTCRGVFSTSLNADYMALEEGGRREFWDLDDVLTKGVFFTSREAAVAHMEATADE